ncbi:PGF-CTERM sorting domain-containing protein [Halorubrum sp. Boch-26]|uniref:PGF-CTERM sorting domain-containing protein n=1 Tax=Halorubrum sp. Boch-26 TaxID=2994426 RepID=UPI002469BB3A|nr:PGF-CTERM sorting domain-containing protein [Halorubrum sp. Boch-26]
MRTPLERNGGRFGIRPVTDFRTVARDDSAESPMAVSPAIASARAASGSAAGAAASENGAAHGETGREGTDAAAGAPGASGPDTESGMGDDPAAKSDATGADPRTPSYDDAPIRTTAEDVPGFGPLVTLVALLLAGRLAARRRGPMSESETSEPRGESPES